MFLSLVIIIRLWRPPPLGSATSQSAVLNHHNFAKLETSNIWSGLNVTAQCGLDHAECVCIEIFPQSRPRHLDLGVSLPINIPKVIFWLALCLVIVQFGPL